MGINRKRILAFIHIPKAAGSTVTHILRSKFGLNHCRVISKDEVYKPKDLIFDQKIYPRLQSISGHQLRPHINFGSFEEQLFWFVMLREPVERFISQYKWWRHTNNSKISFEKWCEIKGKKFADFQVKWLAGESNVEKAIEILDRKIDCVGTQTHFNESLKMLHVLSGENSIPTFIDRRVNASKLKLSHLETEISKYYNQCDIEMYDFFIKNIWEDQKLKVSDESSEVKYLDTFSDTIRRNLNMTYHWLVYRKIKSLV